MSVDQYLARYAQPEIELAAGVGESYDHVLVVPARDEAADFTDNLRAATAGRAVLIIVVVNATDDASPDTHRANAALLDRLRTTPNVLAIDRASAGKRLPARRGVGLARRIGCDVALALGTAGTVGAPWIHTTDADAELPADYFGAATRAPDDVVALTYPFEHVAPADPAVAEAAAAYDTWLRYYVAGLASAGSPYAFHTIGSTIAVRAEAYAAARGVPLRRAGEDFYLLNKLAKLGNVARPECAPIRLSSRPSARVPFGTGPGIAKMAATLAAGRQPLFYAPRAFAALGELLGALERVTPSRGLAVPADGPLAGAAGELGVVEAIDDARAATSSPEALRRRIHGWFDAFRSRQLIHALRRRGLHDVPMSEALEGAPFWPPP